MSLRVEQYRLMYAITTVKVPLSNTLAELMGYDRVLISQRLKRLISAGMVERKPYGNNRVMFMLSLAGGAALSDYLAKNEKPVLCEVGAPTTNARSSGKKFVKQEPLEGAATPRCVSVMLGVYEPAKDRAYYRNDGNKHIKSLGAF